MFSTNLPLDLDIERTYGQRKPLAARSPVVPRSARKSSDEGSETHSRQASISSTASMEAPTPSATEGETATESEELVTDTETETELDGTTPAPKRFTASPTMAPKELSARPRRQTVSQHDLFHRYFRKDVLLLHNIDLFRYAPFPLTLPPVNPHVLIAPDPQRV